MTRHLQSSAGTKVAVTVTRRQLHHAPPAARDATLAREHDIALVRRAIDRMADTITQECVDAMDEVTERADLPREVGTDAIRPVIWNFVHKRLFDGLSAGAAEAQPLMQEIAKSLLKHGCLGGLGDSRLLRAAVREVVNGNGGRIAEVHPKLDGVGATQKKGEDP